MRANSAWFGCPVQLPLLMGSAERVDLQAWMMTLVPLGVFSNSQRAC